MNKKRLPDIDSINELARFWDQHDITDFEDELEEVSEPVFRRGKDVEIHLEPNEVESLEKVARQRGVRDAELIREWILEKLRAA